MAIYVDPIMEHPPVCGYSLWCHMGVGKRDETGIAELHRFAASLGLKRRWYQGKPHHKHYDLVPSKRAMAIRLGAIELNHRDYVRTCCDHPASIKAWLAEEAEANVETRPPPSETNRQSTLFD